jgi:hypothetical protein
MQKALDLIISTAKKKKKKKGEKSMESIYFAQGLKYHKALNRLFWHAILY